MSKPSWLSALNKVEPAVSAEAHEDEHVEPLKAYDTPPPLEVIMAKLITPEPSSNTKLPFAFDAEAFRNNVVNEDNFGVHAASSIPSHERKREAYTWPDFDKVKEVTETGQRVLGELVEQLPEELKVELGKTEPHISIPENLPPGTYTGTIYNGEFLPDYINAMPFMPNAEALLPEPAVGLEGRVDVGAEAWLGLLTPSESVAFDNHIQIVMAVNPLHASYLIHLKGWRSKFFGQNITSPEMAEEHIRLALGRGEEPGGWDNIDHRRIKQAQELLARGFASKAKSESRLRFKQYILKARDEWKAAIEDRTAKMEILNTEVANRHEAYKLAKEMSYDEYMAIYESGE